MIRALALAAAFAGPAAAQDIVANLSQNRINIDATFDGSEIIVFGAVRRGAEIEGEIGVIVTVSGPLEEITVRRKARVAGIWINRDAVVIDAAPSFYAVAATGPLDEVISHTSNLRHAIRVPEAIRAVGAPEDIQDAPAFTEALIRVRREEGYYQTLESAVTLTEGTLFNTEVELPADLVEGDYKVRIFLVQGGKVVSRFETAIDVRKVGLERILFTLAHEQPLLYAVLSLSIAIAAGWGAAAAFRLIRS